ncbi:related to stomatin [Ustilago bromivora]|uniref:Related to stomatin n=1 Tax=Ustilago bromivora TaxID=307758 RepID=A0A8H8QN36_9BASI|nr:related to stomatin [Ustilago bromivora]
MSELGNDTLQNSSHNGHGSGKRPDMTSSAAPQAHTNGLVTVQPLRRSEMQPSYKQNLGLDTVEHGFYGSMINGIGAIAGCFVSLDSVVFWHISNPYRAAFGIADVKSALTERAQTTLRNVVGGRTLQSLVTDREQVALEVQEIVGDVADRWGVQIESILIKDILFSKELQESLSLAAKQRRIDESKVIAAQAEVDAARLMRQAADILASKSTMQTRALESLQAMAKTANSKVIFVPMNLNSLSENDDLPPGGTGPGANIAPSGAAASASGSGGNRHASMINTAALAQLAEM